jgi:hypothetical protein
MYVNTNTPCDDYTDMKLVFESKQHYDIVEMSGRAQCTLLRRLSTVCVKGHVVLVLVIHISLR